MSGHRSKQAGMTLIEVMLSVAIVAMLTAALWVSFVQTARNKDRMTDQVDRYHVVTTALERMQRELSMAFVSTQVNSNPNLQVVNTAFIGTDRGSGDRIDFTSFSHQRLFRNAHESDQNELSYFVTRHPDDNSIKVLARREQNRIDDRPEEGGRIEIMVEDIEEFELEYLDPETNEWTRSWDTTSAAGQPNRLPSQVKITLVVPDPMGQNRERIFATRATPMLPWALNHATYNP